MQSNRGIISKNIIFAIILQFTNLVSGFIVPKIILVSFGSEVNGLVSSINQFLSYVTLLEGGLSGVIMAALYKPLNDKDDEAISSVINAATHFFKRIAYIYLVYVGVFAIVYPIIYHAHYTYKYTVVLVLVLAANLFTQYYFSITYKLLIQADQRAFVVSIVQSVVILLNIIATVVIAKIYRDIIVIKLFAAVFYLLQPLLFGLYVNKNYKINKDIPKNEKAISQRWDGFWQNIAFFIHSNTDIVVLTLFSSLTDVSIYAVYLLVINALKNLIVAISGAVVPTIGNTLAKGNIKDINKAFNYYEYGVFVVSTFLFAAGMSLIVPFVMIYTSGISDANYYQPLFAVLMVLAETVYCLRDPYVSISYAAGHFKQTRKYATFEAVLNIVISVVLVRNYGIVGVAIGTLIAMLYRTIMHIFYLRDEIVYRSPKYAIKMICLSLVVISVTYALTNLFLNTDVSSYMQWIILAVLVAGIDIALIALLSFVFYRTEAKALVYRIIKR